MGRYETWASNLRFSWMGKIGRAVMGGMAAALGDLALSFATQALLERLPQYASDPTSVALTADALRIDAGPTETQASLALRCALAFPIRKYTGTPLGLLLALHFAGFPGALIVTQAGIGYYLTGTPDLTNPTAALTTVALNPGPYVGADVDPKKAPRTNQAIAAGAHAWWMFDATSLDAQLSQWNSRFAVVFAAPLPATLSTFGRGTATFTGVEDGSVAHPWPTATWDTPFDSTSYQVLAGPPIVTDGSMVIASAFAPGNRFGVQIAASAPFHGHVDAIAYQLGHVPASEQARLKSIIDEWRPGRAQCMGVIVVAQGSCFDWPQRPWSAVTLGDSIVNTYAID